MRKNPHGRILKGEPKEQHIFLQKKKGTALKYYT